MFKRHDMMESGYYIKISKFVKDYANPSVKKSGEKDYTFGGNAVHYLKTVQPYYDDVTTKYLNKRKTFEVRKNDRDYKVGDILVLQEFLNIHQATEMFSMPGASINYFYKGKRVFEGDNLIGYYTGEEAIFLVTYILDKEPYVRPGWVIMGIREAK